ALPDPPRKDFARRAPVSQFDAKSHQENMKPILSLAAELAARKTTSQALVEDALMRIAVPSGEGARVFLRTHRESALAEAKASDELRAHGIVLSPLASISVSVKDLFNVATSPAILREPGRA